MKPNPPSPIRKMLRLDTKCELLRRPLILIFDRKGMKPPPPPFMKDVASRYEVRTFELTLSHPVHVNISNNFHSKTISMLTSSSVSEMATAIRRTRPRPPDSAADFTVQVTVGGTLFGLGHVDDRLRLRGFLGAAVLLPTKPSPFSSSSSSRWFLLLINVCTE